MVTIKKEDRLVIAFSQRLDTTNAEEAQQQIEQGLKSLDRDILLDMEALSYISSAGLQVVLFIAKQAKSAGYETYLKGAKEEVWEILKLAGFFAFLKETE